MGSLRSARLLTSVCLLAAACVDSKDVFVQRDLYKEPLTAAEGFLGYNDVDGKTPVCRACHAAQYGQWKDTKHANAWSGLQGGGQVQESCEACHAVDGKGNAIDDPAGWVATREARYQDVQCESCHGPGLGHVTDPKATKPLASILVGVGLDNGCAECHAGAPYPFTDEWARSRHAVTASPAQQAQPCAQCHETRGIFAAWGVDAPYVEQDQQGAIPVVCAVCHDPHDATNEHELRYPIGTQDLSTNLCMKCHQLRGVPDPSLAVGPHSPEGPLLLGEAGWRPPGFMSPTQDFTMPHGSANPGMCATCHMHRVGDSGDGGAQYTGHRFNAIPCVDAQGVPTTGDCDSAQRSFEACAGSGCHFSASTARIFYEFNRAEVDSLAARLNALLAQAPAGAFKTGDGLITTAEGARFNAQLADKVGSVVHNPYLMRALLSASIQQMERDYGLQAVPAGADDHNPGAPR